MLIVLSGIFLLARITTRSGFASRLKQHLPLGPGPMASSAGKQHKATSLDPSRLTQNKSERYSDSELDCLHWSGQGASLSSRAPTTSPGSNREIHGLSALKRKAVFLPLPLLGAALALGPLLGSLATLLVLGSLTSSPTALQQSNSYPVEKGYGRRPVNGY